MRTVWLTARHELRTTLGRKAFWLTTFLLPALVVLLVFLPNVFAGGTDAGVTIPDLVEDPQIIGYVDPAGLLHTTPSEVPAGVVRKYDSEAAAKAELSSGAIDRYYLIPHDYVESGRLTAVQVRYQPLRAVESTELITYVINTGITGNEAMAGLLLNPVAALESRSVDPEGPTRSQDPGANYFLPYLLMFVLYVALAMTSGFMLQSVSREKENRTAEVLLSTVRPRDLMLGKIAGLSTVGLLQVVVWLAVIFSVLLSRGSILGMDLSISAELALRVIPWTIVYFLLGYVMYSSLYAMLGVLAPTARDANQFVFIAIVPLVVPLLFLTAFAERPDGVLSTVLSLFPLTSPVAMVARMGSVPVPWWQLTACAAGLAVFAYFFVLLAGRLFRADNLLSTRALTWSRLGGVLKLRSATARLARRRGDPAAKEAAADGGEQDREPNAAGRASKQRTLMLGLIAVVMLFLGIREYLQGDSSGLAIAVAGVVIGAAAYYRYRRGR